jgi:transcriptional regulator
MYLPDAFKIDDQATIGAFIVRYSFATIVSPTAAGLLATHAPVALKRDGSGMTIVGHVARANPHWESMDGTQESLVIFHGPHGYVSPSWYASSPAVPTWNYAVVHAYGRPRATHDPAFIEGELRELLRHYERSSWRIDDLPREFTTQQLTRVVGFEMPVTRVEAKFKLGQNRTAIDRARTIEQLERQDTCETRQLAAFMREYVTG